MRPLAGPFFSFFDSSYVSIPSYVFLYVLYILYVFQSDGLVKKKKTMRRDSVICTAFTFSAAILLLSSFSRTAVANIWTILDKKQV